MINNEKHKKRAKEVCYESLIFLANHWIQVFQIQKKAKKKEREKNNKNEGSHIFWGQNA